MCYLGCRHLKAQLEKGLPLSSHGGQDSASHRILVRRPWFLPGCWPKPLSVPCHVGLSIGQLTTWQLSSSERGGEGRERMKGERERDHLVQTLSCRKQMSYCSSYGHQIVSPTDYIQQRMNQIPDTIAKKCFVIYPENCHFFIRPGT